MSDPRRIPPPRAPLGANHGSAPTPPPQSLHAAPTHPGVAHGPVTPPQGTPRPSPTGPHARPVTGERARVAPTAKTHTPPPSLDREEPRSGNHEDSWIENRWLAAILDLPELRQQVRRGRVLARKGWVRDLKIRQGLLAAEVSSDLGETHSVKIRMDPIDGPTWVAVVEAISDEAALAADLIRGRLSERLAEIFEEAGHDLFPFDLRDVSSYCSCREDSKVCTGAVATHIHFAEVIQADPMKLLTFRGRDRSWLEDEVRERRGAAMPGPRRESSRGGTEPVATKNGKSARKDKDEDAREETREPAHALKDGFWFRAELPPLTFRIDRETLDEHEAFPVVRALGHAPGQAAPDEVALALLPLTRTARVRLELIQNRVESESETPPPEVEPVPEAEPLDEVLLAAARRQGQLTTGMVAQALGVSAREAREYLMFLVKSGKLVVTGKARGTRYLPAELASAADAVAQVETAAIVQAEKADALGVERAAGIESAAAPGGLAADDTTD